MGENVAGLHRRRITRQRGEGFWAQTLALRHVEHGEPLEERDCLGVLACLARLGLLCFGHETVGIDDHRALLALADIAARLDRKSTRLNYSHSCAHSMPASACKKKTNKQETTQESQDT